MSETSSELNRSLDDIEVMAVSKREWRVRDSRIGDDDARSIIGFIEQKAGTFEVMMFGDPLRFSIHADLGDAIAAFVTTVCAVSELRVGTLGGGRESAEPASGRRTRGIRQSGSGVGSLDRRAEIA